MNRSLQITHKPSGKKYWMEVKRSWGKVYYSFDGGETWNTSKTSAFQDALKKRKLWEVRKDMITNPIKIPEKVLAWREKQRKGSIMKPSTFKAIKRRVTREGYSDPTSVGGKAYWVTVLSRYLKVYPSDKSALRTLKSLTKRKTKMKKLSRKPKKLNPVNTKWIVLWKDGGRAGSVGLTKKNLDELNRQFYLSLIQTDNTGTKHYNILGVKRHGKKVRSIKSEGSSKIKSVKRKRISNNPSVKGATEIYSNIMAIEAKKGSHSNYPNEHFRHDFKPGSKIYGLPDGSILIKGKKKLWKNFDA